MSWSRFDDRYDEHTKIRDAWEADPATVGLHVMATTHCCRQESNGVVEPRWVRGITADLPTRRRSQLLELMVQHGLFDLLPAGQVITLAERTADTRAPRKEFEDLVIGPYDEDRYLVHDFLDRHLSRRQLRLQRDRDAARKPKKDPRDSMRESIPASQWDATKDSQGASLGPIPSHPIPSPPKSPKGDRPPTPTSKGDGRARSTVAYRQALIDYTAWLLPRLGDIGEALVASGYVGTVLERIQHPADTAELDTQVVAAVRSMTHQRPERGLFAVTSDDDDHGADAA